MEQDLSQAVDRLDVRGIVKALKEPKDEYEELKAIPHSFAIEFHNHGPWAMFADSEEEKVRLVGLTWWVVADVLQFKLLGLLQYGAGL